MLLHYEWVSLHAISCGSGPAVSTTLPLHNTTPNVSSVIPIWDNSCFILGSDLRPIAEILVIFTSNKELLLICLLPVLYPVLLRYTAKVRGSWVACHEGEEQFSLLVYMLWLCTYFPVSMEERDGQHIGVVTNALIKEAPPFSIILLVLFITCKDPAIRGTDRHCAANSENILAATMPLKVKYQWLACLWTSACTTP